MDEIFEKYSHSPLVNSHENTDKIERSCYYVFGAGLIIQILFAFGIQFLLRLSH